MRKDIEKLLSGELMPEDREKFQSGELSLQKAAMLIKKAADKKLASLQVEYNNNQDPLPLMRYAQELDTNLQKLTHLDIMKQLLEFNPDELILEWKKEREILIAISRTERDTLVEKYLSSKINDEKFYSRMQWFNKLPRSFQLFFTKAEIEGLESRRHDNRVSLRREIATDMRKAATQYLRDNNKPKFDATVKKCGEKGAVIGFSAAIESILALEEAGREMGANVKTVSPPATTAKSFEKPKSGVMPASPAPPKPAAAWVEKRPQVVIDFQVSYARDQLNYIKALSDAFPNTEYAIKNGGEAKGSRPEPESELELEPDYTLISKSEKSHILIETSAIFGNLQVKVFCPSDEKVEAKTIEKLCKFAANVTTKESTVFIETDAQGKMADKLKSAGLQVQSHGPGFSSDSE